MPYRIAIDEYQRLLIIKALKVGAEKLKPELRRQPGNEIPIGANAYDELIVIISMAEELPVDNKPGMLHEFCL